MFKKIAMGIIALCFITNFVYAFFEYEGEIESWCTLGDRSYHNFYETCKCELLLLNGDVLEVHCGEGEGYGDYQ